MTMIRNALFGISMLALSGSAIAAPAAKTHTSKPVVVAQAPAGDTAAPADKGAKKEKKHTKKATKGEKTEGSKEMKSAPAPETK
jgi:hypothetical protein